MKLNEEIRQARITSLREAMPKAVTAEQRAALNRMLEDLGANADESEESETKVKIPSAPIGRPRKYDIGDRFGDLTITSRNGRNITAECACGTTIGCTIAALVQGGKRGCGARGCAKANEEHSAKENPANLDPWRSETMKTAQFNTIKAIVEAINAGAGAAAQQLWAAQPARLRAKFSDWPLYNHNGIWFINEREARGLAGPSGLATTVFYETDTAEAIELANKIEIHQGTMREALGGKA